MQKLTQDDLYKLEDYAKVRPEFRAKVMAHKKNRQVPIGPNVTLYFEDRLTLQYQIQEILRVEKVFEADGIRDELNAYNQLLPDGNNWKAVFMIEYPDEKERREALTRLINIEDQIWVQVAGFDKVFAIADEDIERETDTKTSAVHFMRWNLSREMIAALKNGANLAMGSDHPNYPYSVDGVAPAVREALAADFD